MKNSMKKMLSFILCVVLVAAVALGTTGCNDDKKTTGNTDATLTDGQTVGEGATSFNLSIVDAEGKEIKVTVKTDKKTVGETLLDLGVVAGEMGEYGLYVKTVNGTTVDYDKDGKYWAFYVDGEYATTSLDLTEITAGETYMLKVE